MILKDKISTISVILIDGFLMIGKI